MRLRTGIVGVANSLLICYSQLVVQTEKLFHYFSGFWLNWFAALAGLRIE